jgi:hypothetical protein
MSARRRHPPKDILPARKAGFILDVVSGWVAFCAMSSAGSIRGEDLLQVAREGHRQAREAITSIHLAIQGKNTIWEKGKNAETVSARAEWWQSGQSFRRREQTRERRRPIRLKAGEKPSKLVDLETTTDISSLDGLATDLETVETKDPGVDSKEIGASIALARGVEDGWLSPWRRTGFFVSDSPSVSLLDILESRDWVKDAASVSLDGEPCIYVRCAGPNEVKVQAWLSVRHGFWVKRLLMSKAFDGPPDWERENDSFKEYPNGVYFPGHAVTRSYDLVNGVAKPTLIMEAFFEVLSINEPIPEESLRVTIPEGTPTQDHRNDTLFVMGPNGQPSPAHPIQSLRRLLPEAEEVVATSWRIPWAGWLAGIVIGLGAAGAILWRVYRARTGA